MLSPNELVALWSLMHFSKLKLMSMSLEIPGIEISFSGKVNTRSGFVLLRLIREANEVSEIRELLELK